MCFGSGAVGEEEGVSEISVILLCLALRLLWISQ